MLRTKTTFSPDFGGEPAPAAVAAQTEAFSGPNQATIDPAAGAYIAARAAAAEYAHGHAPEPEDADEFDAATRMLREPPTDVSGIAIRLGYIVGQAFLHRAGDWDCPHCLHKREAVEPPTDAEFVACAEGQNGGLDALFRALAHLHLGVERLASRQAAGLEAWCAAVAEYEAAQAEEQRLSELADVATASAEAEAPMPSILIDGRATYRTEEQIMQATGLSPERRLEMIVALRSWREARANADERHACAEAHERWDEYRHAHETMEALVDCPAPNPAALAYKVRAWLARAHIDRIGQDVDDPGTLAELLATAPLDGAWAPVRFYQDALRISGQRPDIVAVEPFDVEGWVDDFVAQPGHYLDARGPIYLEPEAFPGGDVRNEPPGCKAWSELTPALRSVVRSYASQKVKLGELPDPYGMADADFPLMAAE